MADRVTFGPFELDIAGERLEKHGVRVKLSGQPQHILVLLLKNPGEVVTREELRQQLWGEDTFVDFEQGLNTAINKLRQTLGDSADRPRYIETIPRQGYRFIAPVAKAAATPAEGQRRESTGESSTKQRLVWIALSAGLAALVVWAAGYWIGARTASAPTDVVTQFKVEPPPGYWLEPAATRQGFDISPDGESLVFTARGRDGRFHAWRRDLSGTALHPIATADAASTVFWGPDSRKLFFAVGGTLRLGDAAGGPFQVLSQEQDRVIYGTVVAPERVLVMANRRKSYLVPIGVGDSEPLPAAYPWPEPLPDGEHILYLAFGDKAQNSIVRAARLGEDPRSGVEIVQTNSRVLYAPSGGDPGQGYLLYVRAGTLMAHRFDVKSLRVTGEAVPLAAGVEHFATSGGADFSVSTNGVLVYQPHIGRAQMTWVDRSGRPTGTVGPDNQGIYYLRLAPDGKRIVAELYNVEDGYARVWIFDAATGNGRPITEDLAGGSVWSPDSSRLVYSGVIVTQVPKLFVRSVTEESYGKPLLPGAHPEQLQVPTDWSGDGRFIVYRSLLQGDLWVADLAGEKSVTPLLDSPAQETSGVFSPDGKWLAFVSDEAGRPEVYLQAFEAGETPRLHGERYRISRSGALSVRWRGDGRELFYAGANGKMYAVPITLGGQLRIGSPVALFDIEIEATTPIIMPSTFDVSADGQRFLLPRLTNPVRDHLVVVRNWEGLLR
jgi:eukaryotic-like serine/threonine-protein kinase